MDILRETEHCIYVPYETWMTLEQRKISDGTAKWIDVPRPNGNGTFKALEHEGKAVIATRHIDDFKDFDY